MQLPATCAAGPSAWPPRTGIPAVLGHLPLTQDTHVGDGDFHPFPTCSQVGSNSRPQHRLYWGLPDESEKSPLAKGGLFLPGLR